jgi:hypothetical protein
VHLLMDAEERSEVSGFMQEAAGEFAREYNRRKRRMNAFLGDNFHATLVESGRFLFMGMHLLHRIKHEDCGEGQRPLGAEGDRNPLRAINGVKN